MIWRLAFWWHGWRYRRQARHLAWCDWCGQGRCTCRAEVVEQPPDQDFYGSMDLDAERGWVAGGPVPLPRIPYWPAPEVAHSGWWGQTAAGLAPEALALAPDDTWHDGGWLCGPEQPQERKRSPGNENRDRDTGSGPGLSLVVPGPDTTRLAWLDRQLDGHAEWARRMRGQVTGWGLEAAAA